MTLRQFIIVSSCYVRFVKVRSGYVRLGQVKKIMSGYIRLVQVSVS
jgi:hypothetical protein